MSDVSAIAGRLGRTTDGFDAGRYVSWPCQSFLAAPRLLFGLL